MSEKQNSLRTGHAFKWVEWELLAETYIHTILICTGVFTILAVLLTYAFQPKLFLGLSKYLIVKATALSFPNTKIVTITLTKIFDRMAYIYIALGIGCFFLFGFITNYYRKEGEKKNKEEWVAGSKLITVDEYNIQISKDSRLKKTRLEIGGIDIPIELEQRHFGFWGMQGAGKTNALVQVIEQARNIPNSRGIVYCAKPSDYFTQFYDPDRGDILFNPLDKRGLPWNIFLEMETDMDINTIADSLIPEESAKNSNDAFWCTAARKVFVGILSSLFEKGHQYQTNTEIWKAIVSKVSEILKQIENDKRGAAGKVFLQDPKTNMALSAHAVLMQYILCFQYMKDGPTKFSINKWLTGEKGGWIFITNYSDIKDTLRPILSLFIDLLIKKLLALPTSIIKEQKQKDIKYYFFLDEFNSLQKLTSIQDLIVRVRSFGGSVWVGNQDTVSIERIYGKEEATSIIDNLANTLIFAGEGKDYCNYMSEKIGQTRVKKWRKTMTDKIGTEADGGSWQENEEPKPLVEPGAIARMQDLTAYLKLRGFDWCNIKFDYKTYHDCVEPFQIRDELFLNDVKKSQRMARELGDLAPLLASIKEEVEAEGPMIKYLGSMEEQIKELLKI